ncbi:MAG: hypothetical protein R3F11_00195 [Verrucomicrobiales bacterium]
MADAADFLTFENVTRRFGKLTAVDGVSLGIRKGETFSLLGRAAAARPRSCAWRYFDRPDSTASCWTEWTSPTCRRSAGR